MQFVSIVWPLFTCVSSILNSDFWLVVSSDGFQFEHFSLLFEQANHLPSCLLVFLPQLSFYWWTNFIILRLSVLQFISVQIQLSFKPIQTFHYSLLTNPWIMLIKYFLSFIIDKINIIYHHSILFNI